MRIFLNYRFKQKHDCYTLHSLLARPAACNKVSSDLLAGIQEFETRLPNNNSCALLWLGCLQILASRTFNWPIRPCSMLGQQQLLDNFCLLGVFSRRTRNQLATTTTTTAASRTNNKSVTRPQKRREET